MPLAPNTLLQSGKYKIVRFLSSGGFGCTYEGEHVMLHKRIAIKEFFVKDFCNRDEQTTAYYIRFDSFNMIGWMNDNIEKMFAIRGVIK